MWTHQMRITAQIPQSRSKKKCKHEKGLAFIYLQLLFIDITEVNLYLLNNIMQT